MRTLVLISVMFLVTACITGPDVDVVHLKNLKTGETVQCGKHTDNFTVRPVWGDRAFSRTKEQHLSCVEDLRKAGFVRVTD
jgi:hypothetical protein